MSTTPSLTGALASFAVQPHFGALEDAACQVAKTGLIDTVATALAGFGEPVVHIMMSHLQTDPAHGGAPLLWNGCLLGSASAACINAIAGHSLDYDDVAMTAHPSTVLVPAILAEGHRLGRSGPDVLRAYIVGYEVWAELYTREADAYHLKGWHPTGVFGAVAAAAAVAFLHQVTPEVAAISLSIAASMAGGLVANFGSMMKPVHAGRAAAAGIEAVALASLGLGASSDALEHAAGFLAAISPNGKVDLDSPFDASAHELRIVSQGLSIKRYPVCYSCHRVIDGTLDLVIENELRAEDIAQVQVTLGAAQAEMLRYHRPRTALEAKFSIEFAVAAALVSRRVGLRELTNAYTDRADVQAQFPKVSITIDERNCPVDPAFAYADRVRITARDGRVLDSGEVRFALGHAKRPLNASGLGQKFFDCISFGASGIDAQALYGRLQQLERQDNIGALFDGLRTI